jgi:hypothetical protein
MQRWQPVIQLFDETNFCLSYVFSRGVMWRCVLTHRCLRFPAFARSSRAFIIQWKLCTHWLDMMLLSRQIFHLLKRRPNKNAFPILRHILKWNQTLGYSLHTSTRVISVLYLNQSWIQWVVLTPKFMLWAIFSQNNKQTDRLGVERADWALKQHFCFRFRLKLVLHYDITVIQCTAFTGALLAFPSDGDTKGGQWLKCNSGGPWAVNIAGTRPLTPTRGWGPCHHYTAVVARTMDSTNVIANIYINIKQSVKAVYSLRVELPPKLKKLRHTVSSVHLH